MIVEDNRADVFLIRESIGLAKVDADLYVVQDGEQAIEFLDWADRDPVAPQPSLVILDLNLPKRPGREVLVEMHHTAHFRNTPVLVVTSSDSERDREEMAKLGAKAYFRKPSQYDHFMKLGDLVKKMLEEPAGPASGDGNPAGT